LQGHGGREGEVVFAYGGGAVLAIAWAIGIVCTAAGAYLWATREAKA